MDPRTADLVQIYKGESMDPRTLDLVQIYKGESMDPRTVDSVAIYMGKAWIHGPPIWSEFIRWKHGSTDRRFGRNF